MDLDPDLLYPFGFVAGTAPFDPPPHFVEIDFEIPLFCHPHTKYAVYSNSASSCFISGEVIDPEHPLLSLDELCEDIVRKGSHQDRIDRLIGRFAIYLRTNSRRSIQSDASAMRSLYWRTNHLGSVVGTHAQLIADAIGTPSHSIVARSRKLGCPGIFTPYTDVFRLPPNVLLDLDGHAIERVFPLGKIPSCNIKTAWDFALERASSAAKEFSRRIPLNASLTAGRDSRMTLLALREVWDKTHFFTYTIGNHSHETDREIAEKIAATLSLNHTTLEYASIEPDPKIIGAIKRNTFGFHQHGLAQAYYQHSLFRNKLHIRSNMLEITRSNLYASAKKNQRWRDGLASPIDMAEYYCTAGKLPKGDEHDVAFNHYFQTCDVVDAQRYISSWDLFFIEHRMGAWRSGIIEESDIAFDTVNLFNSREILARFFGTPQEQRSDPRVLESIIGNAIKPLRNVPFNPKKTS